MDEVSRAIGVPLFTLTRWWKEFSNSPLSMNFSQKVYVDELEDAASLGCLGAHDALVVEADSLLSMRWDLLSQRLESVREMGRL